MTSDLSKRFSATAGRLATGALAAMLTLTSSFVNAQQAVKVASGAPTTSDSAIALYADSRAQHLSRQEKIVAISMLYGRSNKTDPNVAKSNFVAALQGIGIPAKVEMDIVDGAGVEIGYFVGGDSLKYVINGRTESRYRSARTAIEALPLAATQFVQKYPEAVVKPPVRTAESGIHNN